MLSRRDRLCVAVSVGRLGLECRWREPERHPDGRKPVLAARVDAHDADPVQVMGAYPGDLLASHPRFDAQTVGPQGDVAIAHKAAHAAWQCLVHVDVHLAAHPDECGVRRMTHPVIEHVFDIRSWGRQGQPRPVGWGSASVVLPQAERGQF